MVRYSGSLAYLIALSTTAPCVQHPDCMLLRDRSCRDMSRRPCLGSCSSTKQSLAHRLAGSTSLSSGSLFEYWIHCTIAFSTLQLRTSWPRTDLSTPCLKKAYVRAPAQGRAQSPAGSTSLSAVHSRLITTASKRAQSHTSEPHSSALGFWCALPKSFS